MEGRRGALPRGLASGGLGPRLEAQETAGTLRNNRSQKPSWVGGKSYAHV